MILFIVYKTMEKVNNIDFVQEQAKYNYKICVYVNQPRINVVCDSPRLRTLFAENLDKLLDVIKAIKQRN